MIVVFSILAIIASILLIIVVLAQPGKSDMASGLSGLTGQMSSVFGAKQMMDTLQKITMVLAGVIAAIALITNLFFVGSETEVKKPVTEGVAAPIESPQMPLQTVPQAAPESKPAPAKDKKDSDK